MRFLIAAFGAATVFALPAAGVAQPVAAAEPPDPPSNAALIISAEQLTITLPAPTFREQGLSGASPCRPTPPPAPAAEQEIQCWREIVNSTEPADFGDYLRHFPNGVFRTLAVTRLNALLIDPNDTAGCYFCSTSGEWRLEPTLVMPTGRFVLSTDTHDPGEIDVFDNLKLQLAGMDAAWRPKRWLRFGLNVGLGIGHTTAGAGLVTYSGSVFVQLSSHFRVEYGGMYARSGDPDKDATQRDRTATFVGIASPQLSNKITQLIGRIW